MQKGMAGLGGSGGCGEGGAVGQYGCGFRSAWLEEGSGAVLRYYSRWVLNKVGKGPVGIR